MPESTHQDAPQTQTVEKVLIVKEVERSTLRPLNFLAALPIICLLLFTSIQGFAAGSVWPFLLSIVALVAYYLLQKQILDRLSCGVKVIALVEEPIPTPAPCTVVVSQEEMEEPSKTDSTPRETHWSEEPYPDPDSELDPNATA
jgi:hypothetical protein